MSKLDVLVLSELGNEEIVQLTQIPRVGDKIAMFYKPIPTVTTVIWLPNRDPEQWVTDNNKYTNIDVIILVE